MIVYDVRQRLCFWKKPLEIVSCPRVYPAKFDFLRETALNKQKVF